MGDSKSISGETRIPRLLFDHRDHELLGMVNEVLGRQTGRDHSQRKFYPLLHPRGIKELAETRGFRIAYAVIHLLESLEAGQQDERLTSLRSLRDEVLNASEGSLPRNTARVLMQIMKDLVRSRGDYTRQLILSHEFRQVATGKPRIVRKHLRRYHLIEMPEAWNHLAFDDHVHDINTKGRKSATHLIMDAWIKGIRRLRVIYYNYIQPQFATELLEAAEIMGITIRIGIELSARFRDRYVQLIWVPRGFQDSQSFLAFLDEDPVQRLMEEGRKVSEYQHGYVLDMLRAFNLTHREAIHRDHGLALDALSREDFLAFVRPGQPSLLHLAKFIHSRLLPLIRARALDLQAEYAGATRERRLEIEALVEDLNRLDDDRIHQLYLAPAWNPDLPDPKVPVDGPDVPELLRLTSCALLERLAQLRTGYRITLNLSDMRAEDVLELLYDCQGMITRLEIFNLKDYSENKISHIPEIVELQMALNEGNIIKLKGVIRQVIDRVTESDRPDRAERVAKLTRILHQILKFKKFYQTTPLKSRIGSDSTGQSARMHGMGLAIVDSLPPRARREVHQPLSKRTIIPLSIPAYRRTTFIPNLTRSARFNRFVQTVGSLPLLRSLFYTRRDEWISLEETTQMTPSGNIVTLGGIQEDVGNNLTLEKVDAQARPFKVLSWKYLNNRIKHVLKILLGFVPAFATFALSYDWWLLKYGGALIWFGITGFRNVVQSVLGGGGLKRSPLLRWNDYISWERITDSLLFTGFSVPLLDLVVKTLILDHGLGITTTTNPMALYALMALANGIYLSTHNAFRGLPRGAIIGNFFRSVFSIPIAIAFNMGAEELLHMAGFVGVEIILQKWAAIVSKTASDLVASIIEGLADRHHNVHLRLREYKDKLTQLIETYSDLELLFPDTQVLETLKSLGEPEKLPVIEIQKLENQIIVHALDLLYFWFYQPRARTALRQLARTLSPEEIQILVGCQHILSRQRDISMMFIDGIIGKNFSRGLSFYLNQWEAYLKNMRRLLNGHEAPAPALLSPPPSARLP
ncbi:MAG: hypothetical protein KKB20_19695 [Proteobacteria bacterium]|nr:hypothetical protein [Pseudomonadota bacterium]